MVPLPDKALSFDVLCSDSTVQKLADITVLTCIIMYYIDYVRLWWIMYAYVHYTSLYIVTLFWSAIKTIPIGSAWLKIVESSSVKVIPGCARNSVLQTKPSPPSWFHILLNDWAGTFLFVLFRRLQHASCVFQLFSLRFEWQRVSAKQATLKLCSTLCWVLSS